MIPEWRQRERARDYFGGSAPMRTTAITRHDLAGRYAVRREDHALRLLDNLLWCVATADQLLEFGPVAFGYTDSRTQWDLDKEESPAALRSFPFCGKIYTRYAEI